MSKWNSKFILTFLIGFLLTIFLLPYLRTIGLSFDVLLVTLFGEESILALVFSLLLIATIVFALRRFISKTAT